MGFPKERYNYFLRVRAFERFAEVQEKGFEMFTLLLFFSKSHLGLMMSSRQEISGFQDCEDLEYNFCVIILQIKSTSTLLRLRELIRRQ
jgi:hypothetical protein